MYDKKPPIFLSLSFAGLRSFLSNAMISPPLALNALQCMWRKSCALNKQCSQTRVCSLVTITSSDICIWPISREVHLTQGGPINAKDLVSPILWLHWIPIQLPFTNITEESITCPKGAAHRALLSGLLASLRAAHQALPGRLEVTKSQPLSASSYFWQWRAVGRQSQARQPGADPQPTSATSQQGTLTSSQGSSSPGRKIGELFGALHSGNSKTPVCSAANMMPS